MNLGGANIVSARIKLVSILLDEPSPKVLTLESEGKYIEADLPIAIKKGIRLSQHPMNKYVFYSKVSKKYKSFMWSLSFCDF